MKISLYGFTLLLVVISGACKKELSCENCLPMVITDTVAAPIFDSIFYNITIDGINTAMVEGVNEAKVSFNGYQYAKDTIEVGYFDIASLGNDLEQPVFSLWKGRYLLPRSFDDFCNFYKPGDYKEFCRIVGQIGCNTGCVQIISNGMVIFFRDSTGTSWTSFYGIQPANSIITITSQIANDPFLIVNAAFSCFLYDKTGMNRRKVTGEFRLRLS